MLPGPITSRRASRDGRRLRTTLSRRTLDKDLIAARDALHNARLHLDDTKERHSKQDAADLGDAEVISDGDGDEESMKMDTSDLIIQGITSMVEGLDKIRVRPAEEEEDQMNSCKEPLNRVYRTWIKGALAFSSAWQVVLQETCYRRDDALCFPDMNVNIWNHSIIHKDDFYTPWEASIAAVVL